MKVFDSEKVRNVGLVGHGDSGKTSLTSAFLFLTGATNRLGQVDDGNSVTDYDDDEIARKITINTSVAHCEWKQHKINLVDTPGYPAFILDAKSSIVAADTALVVIDAVAGVEVQTEKVWSFADEHALPRALVINKLDRDRSSFERSLTSAQEAFGRKVVPVQIPIGEEKDFKGVVDLIGQKAYLYKTDGSGKFEETAIPDELQESASIRRDELVEMVAESDDALMEKFFEEGSLSHEDLLGGLRGCLISKEIFPVYCASATRNIGTAQLLDAIIEVSPDPLKRVPPKALDAISKEETEIEVSAGGAAAGYVFKTLADPFTGRISLVRVFSGKFKSDSGLHNFSRDNEERLGTLQVLQGKAHEPIAEAQMGDICAFLKLKKTMTGDTLGDSAFKAIFQKVDFPEPSISFAIEPKSRGDEDKIGSAVSRIIEEDPSINFRRDPQTKEMLLAGSGQLHVEVTVDKLQRKYGVEVLLKPPKVPYRETITGSAEVQGRHKKQTGGHGQFGDCKIRVESLERGAGFEFANEIFGGAIPRQFIPAVEKGIQESAERGYLAGYPMVDFKATLYDGSYHDVDSSEMAFKLAGSQAFRNAMEKARPVLLEPIMLVEVCAPEEHSGDIMGDLNGRRGRIQGMDVKGSSQVIRAQVPLVEMLNYAPTLTSMTGGRGSYHMENSHYEIVPGNFSEKIIAEARREKEEKGA